MDSGKVANNAKLRVSDSAECNVGPFQLLPAAARPAWLYCVVAAVIHPTFDTEQQILGRTNGIFYTEYDSRSVTKYIDFLQIKPKSSGCVERFEHFASKRRDWRIIGPIRHELPKPLTNNSLASYFFPGPWRPSSNVKNS